jgi:flagellar L-ring protein precursor FlgH
MSRHVLCLAILVSACASGPQATADRPRDLDEDMKRPPSASLWNQDPESLFGNRRAREVGDILTVLVEIDDQAQILNDTQRNRTNDRSLDMPSALGLPQWAERNLPDGAGLSPGVEISSQERLRGQGNMRRQDRITLRLAARITHRLPNGDLKIEGQQNVQVGYDKRQLAVTGIVRPEDISSQNTVQHDRIAEADIRYLGRGPLQGTGRPGLGNRLIDIVLPF